MSFPDHVDVDVGLLPGHFFPGYARTVHPGIFGHGQTAGRNYKLPNYGIDADAASFMAQLRAVGANNGSNGKYGSEWIFVVSKAIDTVVKQLKDSGIWTICTSIFPCVSVGGKKYDTALWDAGINLKNPTTSSTWMQFSGSSDPKIDEYGLRGSTNCFVTQTATVSNFNWHLSCYGISFASTAAMSPFSVSTISKMLCPDNANITVNANGLFTSVAADRRCGMVIATRRSTTDMSIYRGGELLVHDTTLVASSFGTPIDMLLTNSGGAGTNAFTAPLAWASIGTSLTDDQAARYSQIVQDFNTRLGRAA